MPNLGVSNCSKILTTLPTPEVLRILRENLVVAYSAHKPDMILGYTHYDDHLDSGKLTMALFRFCYIYLYGLVSSNYRGRISWINRFRH